MQKSAPERADKLFYMKKSYWFLHIAVLLAGFTRYIRQAYYIKRRVINLVPDYYFISSFVFYNPLV